jgi:uncharacterized protein
MSNPAENLAKLKQAYARWHESKGKDLVWLDLMADDVRVLSLAAGRPGVEFTREVRSKEDLRRYLAGLDQDWEMIYYRPDEFIVDGDKIAVMAMTSWKNRTTGRTFESPKADFVIFKDGKIVGWYEFYDTAAVEAAMKLREGAS